MSESIVTSDEMSAPKPDHKYRAQEVITVAGAAALEQIDVLDGEPGNASDEEPSQPRQHVPVQREHAASAGRAASGNRQGPARATSERSVSEDILRQYLREIGKTPLLDAEQEVELSKHIEAGVYASQLVRKLNHTEQVPLEDFEESIVERFQGKGAEAYAKFIEDLELLERQGLEAKSLMTTANLRLVVSIAKRYAGQGVLMLDLVQEGNAGLIRAVEKFDYTKGFKFSTYATWWIRQAITRAIADQARTIRVPVHMVEKINRKNRAERELAITLGRAPTDLELAEELGLTEEQIVELHRIDRQPDSLDRRIGHEGGAPGEKETTLLDLVEDQNSSEDAEQPVMRRSLAEVLDVHLSTLGPREQKIIRWRHGLDDGTPRTLEEIGKILGVTRERVRQLEKQALGQLQKISRNSGLSDFY